MLKFLANFDNFHYFFISSKVVSGIISTKFRRFADYVEYDYFRMCLSMVLIYEIFGKYFLAVATGLALIFYLQSRLIRSNMFSLLLLLTALGKEIQF